mgnify:CR=1 FL=1
MNERSVYLRLRKKITIPSSQTLMLHDVAEWIAAHEVDQRLNGIELMKPTRTRGEKKEWQMFDLLDILHVIKEMDPTLNVEYIGETQVFIQWIHPNQKRKANVLLICLVWLLLFTGSGLAIMNFHTDVSMAEVHRKLFTYLTGETVDQPLWLQIPYSFGLGLGMILFFNRFLKRKLNQEPDPLELEMFQYQQGIHEYRVADELKNRANEARNGKS